MKRAETSASVMIIMALCSAHARADTVQWTDASGFWDVAGNWSAGVPDASDDVVIDVTGTRTVTVRFTDGAAAANSITMTGDEILSIANGTLSIQSASALNRLAVAGSSSLLTLNGPLVVNGAFTHGSGTVRGADLTVKGDATLAFSAFGVMSGAGTTKLEGATSVGRYNLDAGRILRNEGVLTLTGIMDLNATNAAGAGRIENAFGATVDVRTFNLSIQASNQGAGDTGADALFDNSGTLLKSTGGNYSIAVPVHNRSGGLVSVEAGSFTFGAGGSQAGAVTIASNAALGLSGGTHEVNAGASFGGAGTLSLTGAGTVLQLNAPTTVTSLFSMGGGTISGSDLTLEGPVTIAISSSLGVMTGAATTTLKGHSTLSGGANNPFGLDGGRVLRNEGNAIISGVINLNRLDTGAGSGRIDNVSGALIDVQTFNQSMVATSWNAADSGADALFDNAGELRKSTGGNYTIAVPVQNLAGGLVNVQAGSFTYTANGNHSGTSTMAAGTGINLSGGTHFVNAGAAFNGAGTLGLAGAGTVLHLNDPTIVSSAFSMTGGTISGANLTLQGPTTLTISSSQGVMRGTGTTTLQGTSTLGGGPNNTFGLDGRRVLRNEGNATITGVLDLNRLNTPGEGSGHIHNAAGALIDIQTFNQSIHATNWGDLDNGLDASISNAGTFRKSGPGNYTVAVAFQSSGAVEVQGGRLTFSRGGGSTGTLSVSAGASLSLPGTPFRSQGRLQGNGLVEMQGASPYFNEGVVAPGESPGTLTIDGDYAQGASGTYEVELASLLNFDALNILGNIALDGTLRVLSLDGYTPHAGDSFTVMTFDDGVADAGDLTGMFSSILWQGFNPGIAFTASYLDNSVVLNAVASPVPLPAAVWLMTAALAGLGCTVRRRGVARRAAAGAPGAPCRCATAAAAHT